MTENVDTPNDPPTEPAPAAPAPAPAPVSRRAVMTKPLAIVGVCAGAVLALGLTFGAGVWVGAETIGDVSHGKMEFRDRDYGDYERGESHSREHRGDREYDDEDEHADRGSRDRGQDESSRRVAPSEVSPAPSTSAAPRP